MIFCPLLLKAFFMNKLPVYKTEGIILRTADWGDLDRLLTIYTRGYGKIQARAISVRKKESKLNGRLQSFSYGQFLLAKSKTVDIVTDFSVISSYHYLHSHLANLGYAFYFAELIDKLIPMPERDDNVWRLVSRAFEVLNNPPTPLCVRGAEGKEVCVKGDNLPKIKVLFEDKLVEFLGHAKPGQQGKTLPLQRLNYLQSLAGERLNAQKFLAQI